jgi:hypothetical protein
MNTKMHQTIVPMPPEAKRQPDKKTPPAHPSKNAFQKSAPQPAMSNNTSPKADNHRAAPEKAAHPIPTDQAIHQHQPDIRQQHIATAQHPATLRGRVLKGSLHTVNNQNTKNYHHTPEPPDHDTQEEREPWRRPACSRRDSHHDSVD